MGGLNGSTNNRISTLNFRLFPYGYEVITSLGGQPLASGHAILNCSVPLFASSILSYFSNDEDTRPTVEASMPSSQDASAIEYVFDSHDGNRLAVAIANPFPTPASFRLTVVGAVNATVFVSTAAGTVTTFFLDKLVRLPGNATGKMYIDDPYNGRAIYSIGFKYFGTTFSSVVPNALR